LEETEKEIRRLFEKQKRDEQKIRKLLNRNKIAEEEIRGTREELSAIYDASLTVVDSKSLSSHSIRFSRKLKLAEKHKFLE
jgi:hypothetical protein